MLGNNNKIHVCKRPDERLWPECLGEFGDKERTCRVSVMFLGCISYHGVGTLTPVNVNINTERYISILDDNLWPVVAQHFRNRPWIWTLKENAACPVSARTNERKRDKRFLRYFTVASPEYRPQLYWKCSENYFKKCIKRRISEIENADDLKRAVQEIFTVLHQHYILSLYASIP